jgi:hypothetical protein
VGLKREREKLAFFQTQQDTERYFFILKQKTISFYGHDLIISLSLSFAILNSSFLREITRNTIDNNPNY